MSEQKFVLELRPAFFYWIALAAITSANNVSPTTAGPGGWTPYVRGGVEDLLADEDIADFVGARAVRLSAVQVVGILDFRKQTPDVIPIPVVDLEYRSGDTLISKGLLPVHYVAAGGPGTSGAVGNTNGLLVDDIGFREEHVIFEGTVEGLQRSQRSRQRLALGELVDGFVFWKFEEQA